jgi:penicillin G amidase
VNALPRTAALLALTTAPLVAQTVTPFPTKGVRGVVTMVRDSAGVVHITAENEHDLFFAQGWSAARDRLFQLELWRRQATGTLAEVLGPAAVRKDIASRAFRFRGNMRRELAHYHPRGASIIGAFVDGINAYITETEKNAGLLPPEFRWLNWTPQRWTPAIVISRHNGLSQNADAELDLAKAVATLGEQKVRSLVTFAPDPAVLALDSALRGMRFAPNAVKRFTDRTAAIPFTAADIDASVRTAQRDAAGTATHVALGTTDSASKVESNNWVISGARTASGKPILANDPHRAILSPSLRYFVHLQAPGWNVIGGGEPSLPGISIGHNEHGAWGLTIFGLDTEDVYVYQLKPGAPTQYRYRGRWEAMRAVAETLHVRGAPDTVVTLHYTKHGPVTMIDSANGVAYAVRAAWLDIGGAPYLASIRFGQVRSWREFRAATAYHRMPAENLIWADRRGTIGWQAVGFAPIRRGWTGLLPVPGDGRYEWAGYLPILQLPSRVNPASGHIATANEMNVPTGYRHANALGRQWAEPWRVQRVREVLDTTRGATADRMAALQQDVTSIFTRTLLARLQARGALAGMPALGDPSAATLRAFDGSAAAGILLERELLARNRDAAFENYDDPQLRSVSSQAFFAWIDTVPRAVIDAAATAVGRTLAARTLGLPGQTGDSALRTVAIRHPLSAVVNAPTRRTLDHGPLPRGGAQHTINMTGAGDVQSSGASFRVVIDLADWDASLGTNTPGQSGDPRSPFYRNLFTDWAAGRYFPLAFTPAAIERRVVSVERLLPVR